MLHAVIMLCFIFAQKSFSKMFLSVSAKLSDSDSHSGSPQPFITRPSEDL